MKRILHFPFLLVFSSLSAQPKNCVIHGKINKEITYDKVYLRIGSNTLDSACVKNGSFEFVTAIHSKLARIQSEVTMQAGMKLLRSEVVLYLSPGNVKITIDELSDTNPEYSFTINGTGLAVEYDKELRKPVYALNKIISELKGKIKNAREVNQDTLNLQSRMNEIVEDCFAVPKNYIKANPSSELGIIALKMMGKGDPTVANGPEELKSLFASLSEDVRNSKAGMEYKITLDKLSSK